MGWRPVQDVSHLLCIPGKSCWSRGSFREKPFFYIAPKLWNSSKIQKSNKNKGCNLQKIGSKVFLMRMPEGFLEPLRLPWTLGVSAVRGECYLQRSGVSCFLAVWVWCWLDPHSIQALESPDHQQTWWTSAILCSPKTGTWTSLPGGSFERTQAPEGSCWALRRSRVSKGDHGMCSASFSMMGLNKEKVKTQKKKSGYPATLGDSSSE